MIRIRISGLRIRGFERNDNRSTTLTGKRKLNEIKKNIPGSRKMRSEDSKSVMPEMASCSDRFSRSNFS
jgi:hypothetical protein